VIPEGRGGREGEMSSKNGAVSGAAEATEAEDAFRDAYERMDERVEENCLVKLLACRNAILFILGKEDRFRTL
jgi:hypothetical protein